MIKSRIIRSEVVENKNPRAKADTSYNLVYVVEADGSLVPALFTDFDIQKAVKRAASNMEDVLPAHVEPVVVTPAPVVRKPWYRRWF
jgi:hypothetical protein